MLFIAAKSISMPLALAAGKGLLMASAKFAIITLTPAKSATASMADTAGKKPTVGTIDAATQATLDAIHALAKSTSNATLVDRGELHDMVAMPSNTIYTVRNNVGSGATDQTCYMFNEDFLNTTNTDNGSGANSVVKTYNDGFSGNLINRIIGAKGDRGLSANQLQITMINNADATQNASAVNNANPLLTTYNGDGGLLTPSIPLATTGTPQYLQPGFLIINLKYKVKRYSQISFIVPVGVTASVKVIFGA